MSPIEIPELQATQENRIRMLESQVQQLLATVRTLCGHVEQLQVQIKELYASCDLRKQ